MTRGSKSSGEIKRRKRIWNFLVPREPRNFRKAVHRLVWRTRRADTTTWTGFEVISSEVRSDVSELRDAPCCKVDVWRLTTEKSSDSPERHLRDEGATTAAVFKKQHECFGKNLPYNGMTIRVPSLRHFHFQLNKLETKITIWYNHRHFQWRRLCHECI